MDKIIATICGIQDDKVCITWEEDVSKEVWLNKNALEQIKSLDLLYPNATIVLTKYKDEIVIRPWDDVLDMDVEAMERVIATYKLLDQPTEDIEAQVQYVIHKRKALNER